MRLKSRIAVRLKAARERAGLTQYQLAVGLRLNHRQTVARVEEGQRSLTAEELIRAMDFFGVDLEYFTDPFRLDGEGEFTFRTDPEVTTTVVDEFESRAGRWIAMYRELSREREEQTRWLELKLALSRRSSFGDARTAGEAFAERMQLGDCPAAALPSALEERLGVLVLDVDAPPGIASAACRARGRTATWELDGALGLNCVLLNRHEPEGRRSYGLAHGLFHLLTWDAIPPARLEPVDVPRRGKGWYVARLAESFATAVLMSGDIETPRRGNVETPSRGNAEAPSRGDAETPSRGDAEAPLFGGGFIRCVAHALATERLSVTRAASVLELSLPELASLLGSHGHEADFVA